MGLKTILFVGLFGAACIGTIYSPMWPLLGYVAHYCIGPERQWWHAPVRPLGIRYSLTLAALTALGMAVHWGQLRSGRELLCRHEKLFLLFLGVVWLSVMIGPETVGRYTSASGVDHPSVKFTKIAIFALMLTHVVSNLNNLNRLIWVLILGAMVLGMQAWATPLRSFVSGRLENVGGPDFAEANFFAAFMATLLWIIGVQFLRSGWKGRVLCFIAGGFTANAVVLARSRGAVVGLAAGGLAALIMAPKRYRGYIAVGLVLAGIGFLRLSDEQFLTRAMSIFAGEEERDTSAQSRIVLARAGLHMWQDHPLGVGAGNFYQTIGDYLPGYAGKDAHNTYIRCLTELGIQGFLLFAGLLVSGFYMLYRIGRASSELPVSEHSDVLLLSYGMTCALATLAACLLTISLTYVEFLWWFMMLPVCLQRTVENLQADESFDDPLADELEYADDPDSFSEHVTAATPST